MVHAEHWFPEELLDQVNAIIWKSTPGSKNPEGRHTKDLSYCTRRCPGKEPNNFSMMGKR